MLQARFETDVSRALVSLLFSSSKTERMRLVRASSSVLLQPEADGFLAVFAIIQRDNLSFQDRIETLRLCLDEVRHHGYDGSQCELADHFSQVNDSWVETPLAVPESVSDDEEVRSTASMVMFAFAASRAWEERYRIALAFPALFADEVLGEMCRQLAALAVRNILMRSVFGTMSRPSSAKSKELVQMFF